MLDMAEHDLSDGEDDSALLTLVETIEELSATRTIDEVAAVVRSSARRISGADGVAFVLRDDDCCWYLDEDAIGPLWKGKRFPLTACISGWAMLNRQTVVIPDIYQDDRIPHDAYRPTFVKSLVMTPVRTRDPIAALGAYWAKEHTPPPETVAKLQVMARATAAALESGRLQASLNKELERRTFLMRELDHRVKNTLASVQSIASQTLRTATSPEAFNESFESRLLALSQAHELLTKQAWGKAQLREILAAAMRPFGGLEDGRFVVEGPPIEITPEAAVAVHMTLHELIVNAAKYGALSVATGQVFVTWRIEDAAGGHPTFALEWRERGGPPVTAPGPKEEGFGSRLIRRGLSRDLGGAAVLDFLPDGLVFTFRAPLSQRLAAA
ncbi:histidine kinase [Caulobacter endophyticus]|uniref:histidine kinase n=2 Tax=Caulobacter endophyticus TaxID=2172652 RepID=A0A2T9K4A5_9CAUL|nr:HWE histidine kinase domain-containing protein [Caulobacter endophyticus]PVM90643.1 histidine kinase [Caulobacter endophyticus]